MLCRKKPAAVKPESMRKILYVRVETSEDSLQLENPYTRRKSMPLRLITIVSDIFPDR